MTALLPGFADQLAARAESLAAEHAAGVGVVGRRHRGGATARAGAPGRTGLARRIRRPHLPRGRTLGLSILVAGIAASGAAYASQSLWEPVIGFHGYGQPPGVATASELPKQQLALLSVLRRPQSEADRGAASRYALKFQGGDVVRTNEVRLLATLPHGSAAILIPVAKRSPDHLLAYMNPSQPNQDLLCMWLRDPVDGGGQACATTGEFLSGRLTMGIGVGQPHLTPSQQRTWARNEAIAKKKHQSYVRGPEPTNRQVTVGLVPDGVASIRIGRGPDQVLIPVHDNVFVTSREALNPRAQVWLDATGHVVPRLDTGAIPSVLNFPRTKHPGLAQRSLDAYYARLSARQQAQNRVRMRRMLAKVRKGSAMEKSLRRALQHHEIVVTTPKKAFRK